MQTSDVAATEKEASLPAEWKRTLVSFLIFLHLFALGVAVLSNWNPSPLALRLRRVPFVKPYLEYLALDQSYVPLYGLTFGMTEDTDVVAEVDLKLSDGSEQSFSLPASTLAPRQRWRRDARLAETAADLTGENFRAVESLLPQAIASHFVAEHGAKGGTLRLRRHFQQPITAPSSSDAGERDPYDKSRYYSQVYEARIIVVGGQVQLLKSEAAAEVAPAAINKGGK
ncbi:MAG TPA: hypothetical protein VNH11_20045 [Pirellulales bacterium]|nr:hypothetical protein [Pirellulales bacterium]